MFMNLSSHETAEKAVNRLIKECCLNLSSHFLRLELLTEKFVLPIEGYEGVERDYVIGVIYSINEVMQFLRSLNAAQHIDALVLHNLAAKTWYDEAIEVVHSDVMKDERIKRDLAEFTRRWDIVNPPKKAPENAAAMAEAFKDDDIEDQPGFEITDHEKGLAAMAGDDLKDLPN